MQYVVIYKDKHYFVNSSSQIKAVLSVWETIEKDFNETIDTNKNINVIEPVENMTVYGDVINWDSHTISIEGKEYSLNDNYTRTAPQEKKSQPKATYYYNGVRYEVNQNLFKNYD